MNSILSEKELEIETLNDRATGDLIFALKNPAFVEYFELEDTKKGNQYENGIMQFTPQQNKIKSELEQWVFHFQNKFQVDETCIIDTTGQEHSRLVLKNIAPNSDLSSGESSAPFFDESFRKEIDQVHIQYPYISPDTDRWVFAYTSPIVLGNGEKPAFYHFEMPVSIFQDLISTENGRMYVIDSDGVLIADSEHKYSDESLEFFDYFPQTSIISNSDEFEKMISIMRQNEMGISSYVENGNTHHVVYEKIALFDWILVYEIDELSIVHNNSLILHVQNNIIFIFSIVGIISILGFYLMSRQFSKPLQNLITECDNIDPENLYPIKTQVSGELSGIKNSINNMIEKIFHYEEKIKKNHKEIESQKEEIESQNQEIEFQNRELAKELGRSEKLQKKKEEFTSMMTHEFKTPLTPILSWAELLASNALDELSSKQTNAVNKIKDNALKLLGLISDVLDAQKLDLNQMKFNKISTNSSEITNDITSTYETVMKVHNIQFNFNNIEKIPLHTDKERIEQVLRIFITNALDFVPKQGVIELKVSQEANFAKFSVIDNGVGIPKENLTRVFHKFYQVDTSLTRKHGGSGLGLAVAKGIADGLGGIIGVDSEYGKGSEFFIKIPLDIELLKNK